MKNLTFVKGTMIQATLVASILLVTSCDNNQRSQQDSKAAAEEHNDAKFDNNKKQKDAQFLVDAAEINLEEIQLGKLAQQKGKTAQTKELGKMMEDAHIKSQRDLTALAKRKQITIPTSPTDDAKDAYNTLNKKSGDDFDKAYADLMVNGHENAISTYEKASTDCEDSDIKNWAIASLPDMRAHLNQSIDAQNKYDTSYFKNTTQ